MLFRFCNSALLAVAFVALSSCETKKTNFTIAAASSLRLPLTEIIDSYESNFGTRPDVIFGASGRLSTQLIQGAPYDLFISANEGFAEKVKHSTSGYKSHPFPSGSLVLWSCSETISPTIDQLIYAERIGIPNPRTAPYGKAAMESLSYYNLNDTLNDKFIYGENVAFVTQYIREQHVDIGFCARSAIDSVQGHGRWRYVNDSSYTPIKHVLLTTDKPSCKAFRKFLASDEAKQILLSYGYH